MVKNLLAMLKNPGSISGSENPPEKGMVPHSNILAWRIPWTEEPGGLQSMGVTKSWTQLSDKHFHVSRKRRKQRRPRRNNIEQCL